MRLLDLFRVREKQADALVPLTYGSGGWHRLFGVVSESFTGAWQRNIYQRTEDILAFYANFACVTLIASDIGKLRIKLVEQNTDGIWEEVNRDSPFWPVLRRPNHYLNRIKFFEQWMISKLVHGNTYVLKERDGRGIVTGLYLLDPYRTKVLQAPNGDVYYQLNHDTLNGVEGDNTVVPSSEIIHDMMVALYHPLCGVSPLTANYLAATQGLNIQGSSNRFFANSARPGGVLSAAGRIHDDTAARLKAYWDNEFTGVNAGQVAVLGDGLKFESMTMNAVDAELIKQLELSAKVVCSTFHVPAYKVGVEPPPAYNNISALNQQYYDQCLQTHIESIELCLDEGLGLVDVPGHTYGTEFDLEGLLRMDPASQIESLTKAIGGTLLTPNEGRKKVDLPALEGGDTVYMQQQNYSLAALNARDQTNPLAVTPQPATQPSPQVNLSFHELAPPPVPPAPTPAAPSGRSGEEESLDLAAIRQFAAWKADSMLSEAA